MSNVKSHGTKSSPFKTSRSTSGVLAARVVTAPPRPQSDLLQVSQEPEVMVELSSNTEQGIVSDVRVANERFIEDSEFLLQASLFLQTAEQQLNNIESSLKQPKFPRKTVNLSIENCEKREYAHKVVKAVLNGHDLKREEIFSVPARFLKDISSKNVKSFSEDKEGPASTTYEITNARKEVKIKSLKKMTNVRRKSNVSLEKYQRPEFSIHSDSNIDLPLTYKKSVHTYNVSSQDNISANTTAEVMEKRVVKEPLVKYREAIPFEIVRKKTTIESSHVPESNDRLCSSPKNAALINILSNLSSSDEGKKEKEDVFPKTKLIQNCLTMQGLPAINIKPELRLETFTHVNILPSKTQLEESSTNKNVSFIEIVFDEKSKKNKAKREHSPKIHKYDSTERGKKKPYEKAGKMLQISEPSVSFSSESTSNCNNRLKEPPVLRKQRKSFNRGKLNDVLNAVTEKLALYVEIPDEVLENTIDRLWVLGDYLEDVYVNSAEGYRQKVRLNFTSLWLHEIIRLIDNEMKNEYRSSNLSSGVSTIVQYIISEVQCASAVSHQQCCILAEENGEIQFYCSHDSQIDRVRKFKKETRASAFLKSLSPSKITFPRPSSTVPKNIINNIPHPTSHSFDRRDRLLNTKCAESNMIPRMFLPFNENEVVPKNISKRSGNERKLTDPKKTETQSLDSFVPEKLAPTKMKDTNSKNENTASNHTLNFYGKNKFMDADQRQKVIQKLGEEVQKMLSWHEQLRLPDHFEESIKSNHSISQTELSEVRTDPPSKKLSSVSTTSTETELSGELRETKAQTNIKLNFQETQSEFNPGLDSVPSVVKSKQTEGVSSVNSSEDVAYEDDWEEDCNTSVKNDNDQRPIANLENQSCSDSAGQDASKSVLADAQDESNTLVDTSTEGAKKFLINPVGNDSGNNTSSNATEKESLMLEASGGTGEEQSVQKDSPKEKEVIKSDSFDSNLPVEKHPIKNGLGDLGSETDIASDFSDREVSTVNTVSDKARNSTSNTKKSGVDSEAETVKDWSLLNSEVVDSGSKVSMSFHFQENSFKENNSGIIRERSPVKPASETNSMFSDKSPGSSEQEIIKQKMVPREDCRNGTKNNGRQRPKYKSSLSENPSISAKLSKSCHELAEKVMHIEQMKNDLLRMLVKPENESLSKLSSSQSLPGLKRKIEEFKEPSFTPAFNVGNPGNFNVSVMDFGSDNFAAPTQKMCVYESVNVVPFAFSESECQNSQSRIAPDEPKVNLKNENSPNDSRVYRSAPGSPRMVDRTFSDSLSESSVSLSNAETGVKSSAEVIPKSNSQSVLTIKNIFLRDYKNRETILKETAKKSDNSLHSQLPREVKTNGTSVAKSFVVLSNKILKHLKQEGELLAQLDSTSSVTGLSETSEPEGNVKTSFENGDIFKKNFCTDKDTSSRSDLVSDAIDHVFINSDSSPPDFEHLLSELSENMRGSVENSDDISGDSVDEIFSMISSERYKVDCSENLETSIKDVLCSDDTGDFVLERF